MRQGLSRALAHGLVLAGCHAVSAESVAPAPKPGDPELETKYLVRRYHYRGREPCESSAEEVVDQQRRCSDEHWAECVYAGSMYLAGCGVAQSMKRAEE